VCDEEAGLPVPWAVAAERPFYLFERWNGAKPVTPSDQPAPNQLITSCLECLNQTKPNKTVVDGLV
jgi:hypothetical protein